MSRLDELFKVREGIKRLADTIAWVMCLEPDATNTYHMELANRWMDYTSAGELYQQLLIVGKQLDKLIPMVQEASNDRPDNK